ncbi:MAG: hypothetical protein NTV54_09365 [Ignavibacteriales bacterium]|nr:hypothetical protein [Ignavibacteriales bacterium]
MKSRSIIILIFLAVSPMFGGVTGPDSLRYSASVDHYALSLKIDSDRHLVQGEARFAVRCLRDSLAELHFLIPPPLEFYSVRDTLDRRSDRRLIDLPGGGVEVVVFLDTPVPAGNTTVVRILFEGDADTTSTKPVFVGTTEFLFTQSGERPWWPHLIAPAPGPTGATELTVSASSRFRVFAAGRTDSSRLSEKLIRWTFTQDRPTELDHCFFVCGTSGIETQTALSADSTLTLRLHSRPPSFDQQHASRVLKLLGEAAQFFSSVTRIHPAASSIDFVVVGNDDQLWEWQRTGSLILVPNSPAFSVDDSASLMTRSGNPWLHHLAHVYAFPVADSLAWMPEAWAGYLSVRFLFSASDSTMQKRERLDLLTHVLDFYPTPSLVTFGSDPQAARGTYVLLMLEYLLGRDLFDGVIRSIFARGSGYPLHLAEFRSACEDAYGSPLDWFFKQWMLQSGYPELVMTSEMKQTNRGTYALQISISQRGDIFTTPADLVLYGNSRPIVKRLFLHEQDQQFEFVVPTKPVRLELDPEYAILRWLPRVRLLAHALTSQKHRTLGRDLPNSEQEALLTLKLDPNNHTGWNSIAYFALAKSAVLHGDLKRAEDLFRKASTMEATEPAQLYPVISLVRLGNVLEMQSKREEALQLYQLALSAGERNPRLFAYSISEAQKYLQQRFVSTEAFWYGFY